MRNLAAWSQTRIKTFRTCPLQYRLAYLDRAVPAFVPLFEVGSRFHAGAAKYVNHLHTTGRTTDFDFGRALALAETNPTASDLLRRFVEERSFDLSSIIGQKNQETGVREVAEVCYDTKLNGHLFEGHINLLEYNLGRARVTDWKTGWPVTMDETPTFQMQVYGWLAARVLGAEEVELVVDYVGAGQTTVAEYYPTQAEEVEQAILSCIAEAEATKEFEPQPGPECAACGHWLSCPVASDHTGQTFVLDPAQAEVMAKHYLAVTEYLAAIERSLKAWTKEAGPIAVSDTKQLGWRQIADTAKVEGAKIVALATAIGHHGGNAFTYLGFNAKAIKDLRKIAERDWEEDLEGFITYAHNSPRFQLHNRSGPDEGE